MQWVDGLALSHSIVEWCRLVQQGRVRLPDFPGATSSRRRRGLIVPNARTAPAFVHAKGFVFARVKHYLNDVGPIAGANALALPWSLRRSACEH
jgi:hypothetical protein